MRIRKFLEGVDPETCDRKQYFSGEDPVCPLAKAGVPRGYTGPKTSWAYVTWLRTVVDSYDAVEVFVAAFDRLSGRPLLYSKTGAFHAALKAAEEMERLNWYKELPWWKKLAYVLGFLEMEE